MMPTTVPSKPTKGDEEAMVASVETPRFSSAWTMASARSSALGSFDLFPRDLRAHLMRPKFLETRNHDFGQVALGVAVSDLDGFIELAFAQRTGHGRH
jgi:hypothetical protein